MKTTGTNIKKKSVWRIILAIGFAVSFWGVFSVWPEGVIALFFPLIFLFMLIDRLRGGLFRTEQRLATSQVRSVAIGLVELRGTVVMGQPFKSPVSHQDCVGYLWIVEEGSKDSDGKMSWTTLSCEARCNDFRLRDATGEIRVISEGVDLFENKRPTAYESISTYRRQGDLLLTQDQDVLLIGNACEKDGELVIAKGQQRGAMFGVLDMRDVENRRVMAPLLRTAGFYGLTAGLISAGILALPPEYLFQLLSLDEQMTGGEASYKFFEWLYREGGNFIPLFAAFGWMAVMFVLMLVPRFFLPKGMRNAVLGVLAGWLSLGVLVGSPLTLILALSGTNPIKVFLIWMLILLASLVFSLFGQRGLKAVVAQMLKSNPSMPQTPEKRKAATDSANSGE
ncbi:hypothetical protein [Pseudomonas fluorescens]|uniref:RING-type E3 ubiquitin transferase n=1 Tax=Pseudomonas fluorescens TaxID=294 RepID=A0A5E7QF24_PSEFL|nr:hypothetical protein [Pseudomonas fluorescens]VVP60776.1 hypothetical protein PS880_06201 [Pseudomonas fluorescens]